MGAFVAPFVATQFATQYHWYFHYLISVGISLSNVSVLYGVFRFKSQDGMLLVLSEIYIYLFVGLQTFLQRKDKVPVNPVQQHKTNIARFLACASSTSFPCLH